MELQATNKQKGMIHQCVVRLGWSEESYRKWLMSHFGVVSIKYFRITDAARCIKMLTDELEGLDNELMATEKQISYIKFLWIGVDYESGTSGDKLLNNFLQRKFKVESVNALSRKQAFGVISALKRMQRSPKEKVTYVIDNKTGCKCVTVRLGDGTSVFCPLSDNQNGS